MTDKHLIYWILKALDEHFYIQVNSNDLLDPLVWEKVNAPDWVLPALKEIVNNKKPHPTIK